MTLLTHDIRKAASQSVLCWLATSSKEGIPNVAPKEAFTPFEEFFLIANIASPQSAKNIRENEQVCLSFINIFIQKGFKVLGKASIKEKGSTNYGRFEQPLLQLTEGRYPFTSLFMIKPERIRPITAPSYFLFNDVTETAQAQNAFDTYARIYKGQL